MNQLKWKSVEIKDTDGKWRQSRDGSDTWASFRWVPISGGYACYVSAYCDRGMDGGEGIRFSPEFVNQAQYVAIENHSPFWCRPAFGDRLLDLPAKVQELFLRHGDGYLCFLPVCDSVFKTLIRGGEEGFEFVTYSNYDGITKCEEQLAFLCMEGDDLLTLAEDCAKAAADLLNNGLALRKTKQAAEVFDYLGWCSWNALMIRVNHQGLLEKAREFSEKGIPMHYAIIDDMWADVPGLNQVPLDKNMIGAMHAGKLATFEGDPRRFPWGMKGAISALKQAGIPKVGVWFPTTGYWAGLDLDGEEAKRHGANTVMTERATFGIQNQTTLSVAPDEEKATRYFDDFCSRVRSWDGDFVKIDNQGFHHTYRNIASIGTSARAIQKAIDKAADKHFGGALINCMGMPSECMFNRTSAVSRCSDDFVPESREWFAKNILQCSYNGLLQGQYYINDWDMWWTDDDQAAKNSLCRAISGGPVYVSDEIGRTDPEKFKPLILRNGRLLRCDESATPTADCILEDPTKTGRIFKIRNRIGKNGVAAVFNIDGQNRSVSGTLSPTQTGVTRGDYVYYEYFSGDCGLLRDGEVLNITLLHNDDFRLYTFVPYNEGGVTVLGRLDLFLGIGAVKAISGNEITYLEGGKLGFYADSPIKVISNGITLSVEKRKNLNAVTVEADQTQVTVCSH